MYCSDACTGVAVGHMPPTANGLPLTAEALNGTAAVLGLTRVES